MLLVGGIGLLDLRLAGLFRALPVQALSAVLTPLGIAGLGLLAGSGAVMLAADAGPLLASDTFRWKVGLIGLALANAALFRVVWRGRMARWDEAAPILGRAMAAASAGLWLWVAALGRLIAYA